MEELDRDSPDAPALWGEYVKEKIDKDKNVVKPIAMVTEDELKKCFDVTYRNQFYKSVSSSDVPAHYGQMKIKLRDNERILPELMKLSNELKSRALKDQVQCANLETNYRKLKVVSKRLEEKSIEEIGGVTFKDGFFNEITANDINVSHNSRLNMLRKCIAVLLTMTGFSKTTEDILNILTEYTEHYIQNFVRLLNCEVIYEQTGQRNYGFCDPIDKTLHRMGVGSALNLSWYYNTHEGFCESRRRELMAHVSDAMDAFRRNYSERTSKRPKLEPGVRFSDTYSPSPKLEPEIHFSDTHSPSARSSERILSRQSEFQDTEILDENMFDKEIKFENDVAGPSGLNKAAFEEKNLGSKRRRI